MDCQARAHEVQLLVVELYAGEIDEEECVRHGWMTTDLLLLGGWVAEPRTEGPGICRPHANPAILPLSERLVTLRGQWYLAPCHNPGAGDIGEHDNAWSIDGSLYD